MVFILYVQVVYLPTAGLYEAFCLLQAGFKLNVHISHWKSVFSFFICLFYMSVGKGAGIAVL
jgi:hypothetical protein